MASPLNLKMKTLQSQLAWCAKAQWVMAGTLLVMIAAFFVVGYRPMTRKLHGLNEQIVVKRKELDEGKAKANNLPLVERRVAELQQNLKDFDKKLPKTSDMGPFMKDITVKAEQRALRGLTYQPMVPRKNELFAELPISLNFEGDFNSAFEFLRQIEDMERLTRVRKIEFSTRDAKLGLVDVQMTMNIYYTEG